MICEDSITRISHLFCGDEGGYYSYKTGPRLVSFSTNTLARMMNTNLDFLHAGYMYITR